MCVYGITLLPLSDPKAKEVDRLLVLPVFIARTLVYFFHYPSSLCHQMVWREFTSSTHLCAGTMGGDCFDPGLPLASPLAVS